MKGYWLRVVVAFLLLKLASSVMKQAETVLSTNVQTKDVTIVASDVESFDSAEVVGVDG